MTGVAFDTLKLARMLVVAVGVILAALRFLPAPHA
jgi:hypothetical protein